MTSHGEASVEQEQLPEKHKKTNAEQCKDYRNKQKEKDPTYYTKEKKRIAAYRELRKTTQTVEEKLALRKKETERKRKYRQKKKQQDEAVATNARQSSYLPYRTPQSLGKAIHRVTRKLPSSPRKKKAVIQGLANRIGLQLEHQEKIKVVQNIGNSQFAETLKLVQEFYTRADIVYTMPGMKDEVTLWIDGKKVKERKYYLTMFLREAFRIFIETYPENKIGFSKFCSLRPKNVFLVHETPVDQCKCRVHENFISRLKGLHIQYNSVEFWESVLCDTTLNSKCWQADCTECSRGKKMVVSLPPEQIVSWREWQFDQQTESGKVQKRLQSVLHQGCVGQLREVIEENFNEVIQHINVKRIQARQFQDDQENPAVRILQMDFAMNYSCEYQDEVQSALWSRSSVTLFTAATMYNGVCKTFLVCSDTKDKSKDTVAVFVDTLYKDYLIPESTGTAVTEHVIWTDGPSSEFKNKYMMKLLQILSKKYGCKFTWKYFATSHGKGIVDGIGGRAKSLVRTEVMSKKTQGTVVQSSKDFAKTAGRLLDKTTVIHISQEEIDKRIDEMAQWDDVVGFPGIMKMHVACCNPINSEIQLYENALAGKAATCNQVNNEDTSTVVPAPASASVIQSLEVGDWCVVTYDNQQYPGEVTNIINGEVEVSVMHRTGRFFKWPDQPDRIFYNQSSSVKKLEGPPAFIHNIGRMILSQFSDFE